MGGSRAENTPEHNAGGEPEDVAAFLDDIDRRILNRIQSDFPTTSFPFRSIAAELDLRESQVIARVRRMRNAGIIRRIGANFVPEKLGYVSTLCAARVPASKIESFTKVVNQYEGVTHNYQRDDHFNIWFTFIAPSMRVIERHLRAIARESGIRDIINLPATRVYKIKAHFKL